MSSLTDLVDPFNGELSQFGYKLNNIFGFDIHKDDLQKLIDNSEGNVIRLGFNARTPDLVLRELSPEKLRLALRLAKKMFDSKDCSIVGMIQLSEIYRDIERIGDKLNNERWMD